MDENMFYYGKTIKNSKGIKKYERDSMAWGELH